MAKNAGRSQGRQRLVRWIKVGPVRERGQSAIARALGISQAAVRQWVAGIARPGQAYRIALQELTGVAATDWELPEEKRALERTLKRIARSSSTPAAE